MQVGVVLNLNITPYDEELLLKHENTLKQPEYVSQAISSNGTSVPQLNLESLSATENEQNNEPLLQNRGYLEKSGRELNILDTSQLNNKEI